MPRIFQRRPSAPLVISLLALFVALGGPAQAAKLVRSKDVKDRSLQVRDLSRKAVKELRKTPRGSVGERALGNSSVTSAKLRNGSVTSSKLGPSSVGSSQLAPAAVGAGQLKVGAVGSSQIADGAVSGAKLADGSLNGAKIADGSLTIADFARFSGRFSIEIPAVHPGTCWAGEPKDLAPEQARADISDDLVIVTPGREWPEDKLAFTRRDSANTSRFVIAACNVANGAVPTAPVQVGFGYAVLDLP